MNRKRIILFIGSLLFLIQGCNNHKWETNIPPRKVNFRIDLDYTEDELKIPYKFATFPYSKYPTGRLADEAVGYGGLLIFSGLYMGNPQIYAYDLACQVEADSTILVAPDNDGFATCTKCKAVYNMANGGEPVSGADVWLHKYNVNPVFDREPDPNGYYKYYRIKN